MSPQWPDTVALLTDEQVGQLAASATVQNGARVVLSDDVERATQQTIEEMWRHVRRDSKDPVVRQTARAAIDQYCGGAYDPQSIADACWSWAKANIEFVHDETLMQRWTGRTAQEVIVTPAVMVRMQSPKGDCDCFSTTVSAMLESCGVPSRLVTIAADPEVPGEWSHVYSAAVMPDGSLYMLDASHGDRPGWQADKWVTRRKVWAEPRALPRWWIVAGILFLIWWGCL